MDNKPPFDRSLIPPLLFGAFSIFGICLVLLLARLSEFRPALSVESTATPYQYLFLGTEPGIATITEEPLPTAAPDKKKTPTPRRTPTKTSKAPTQTEGSIVELASPTRTPVRSFTATPTTASSAPLNPGSYDDTDARFDYTGIWIQQNNVSGVFKNTLHVSNTLDNFVTFRFIGEQIRISYQSGPGLGTIRINIDGLEIDHDESADVVSQSEWISPLLINGTHTVTIVHLSGGSINLDMIIVPDVIKTATPTP